MTRRPRTILPAILLLAVALGPAVPVSATAGDGGAADEPRAAPPAAEPGAAEPPPAYGRTPESLLPFHNAEPYRRFFVDPLAFRGPGREKPEPEGLESVRIGLLAPLEGVPDVAAGRSLKRGVDLALEEANDAGGYRGVPFELIVHNDQALWGSSGNTLVEFAYHDRVWVVIGSIDSNSTHVAIRAALKAELPVVAVGSSDPTITETGIPWVIRCNPDDRQTGYRLAQLLFEEDGRERVAVVRASDRYGRFGVMEFRDAARRLGRQLPMEILLPPEGQGLDPQLERLAAARVDAVVLWARAEAAARIVRQMRARGMDQPVYGTDRLATPAFVELAGDAAEGVTATSWVNPARDDGAWVGFVGRFRERFGAEPDAFAAYGYDAAHLVIRAIRQEGLNRARLRDALTGLRSYSGVSGTMMLDATSNNVSPIFVARVRGGQLVFDR